MSSETTNSTGQNPYADAGKSVNTPNPQANPTPSDQSETQGIPSIGDFNGPVVLFYGPRSVGKTVALLRLLHYITNSQECAYAFEGFRDDSSFLTARQGFESALQNLRQKPPRTEEFNFLLLNITRQGKPLFKVLEAPGEHFFSTTNPENMGYPTYLNQIYRSDNKKVFVIFLADDMFSSLSHRENYAKKIALLINKEMQPKRDRLIILYNKIDQNPELFQGGRVNEQAVMDKVYGMTAFQSMVNAMRTNRGLREVIFVPFYSGNFNEENRSWNISENHYPQLLWDAINRQLTKRWLWF